MGLRYCKSPRIRLKSQLFFQRLSCLGRGTSVRNDGAGIQQRVNHTLTLDSNPCSLSTWSQKVTTLLSLNLYLGGSRSVSRLIRSTGWTIVLNSIFVKDSHTRNPLKNSGLRITLSFCPLFSCVCVSRHWEILPFATGYLVNDETRA